GSIPIGEFEDVEDLEVGDEVEVLLVRLENEEGTVILSKERAAYRQNWEKIVKVFHGDGLIKGKVKAVVKGGLTVNIGVEAFLPGSQIDIVPPKDLQQFVGNTYDYKIVKINDDRKNVVLSRRELIEQERAEKRDKFMETIKNGSTVNGEVTNLVPYGAFVEIEEGVEGLIHVSELSWTKRITRPSDVLTVGQELEAVVLGVNKEEQKISLGVRQLEPNPWDEIEHRYQIGRQVKGIVRNMTAYGAFVELEEGIDGMIHVSDMSWTRKINHPSEMIKKGDEVEAVVIDIDKQNQRISLGMKQLDEDPWKAIEAKYKIGDMVKGKVSKIATFGAFVALDGDID